MTSKIFLTYVLALASLITGSTAYVCRTAKTKGACYALNALVPHPVTFWNLLCTWRSGQCVNVHLGQMMHSELTQNTFALDQHQQPNFFSDYDDDEEEEGDNDEVGRFYFDEHDEGEDGIEGKTSYLRGS